MNPGAGLPTDPAMLRNLTVKELEKLADKLRPVWDGKGPTGASVNWSEYVKCMRESTSYVGELEMLAAAQCWGLRVVVVRPGLASVYGKRETYGLCETTGGTLRATRCIERATRDSRP